MLFKKLMVTRGTALNNWQLSASFADNELKDIQ